MEVYRRIYLSWPRPWDCRRRGHLLGIHMEGPYLSGEEGAVGTLCQQDAPPGSDEFDSSEWARGQIALLTLAPEREGRLELTPTSSGIQNARLPRPPSRRTGTTIQRATTPGLPWSPILGNGCPSMLPRHENIVIHQLANDSLIAGLITTGIICRRFIVLPFAARLRSGICRVRYGPYRRLRTRIYETLGNRVRLTATGRIENVETPISRFRCTMVQCMRYLRALGLLSEDDLWRVGFETRFEYWGGDRNRRLVRIAGFSMETRHERKPVGMKKVALVTGASSGIGQATAVALARPRLSGGCPLLQQRSRGEGDD